MKKYLIRKISLYGILILLCAIVQLNFPDSLEFRGQVPDLLFVLTIVIAYFNGIDDGIAVGIVSGLIKNVFSGRSLGLGILIMMYVAIISSMLLRKYLRTGFSAAILQIILISAAYFIMTGFVSYMIGDTVFSFRDYSSWWFLNRLIPGLSFNVIISVILMPPVKIFAGSIFKMEDENKLIRPKEMI